MPNHRKTEYRDRQYSDMQYPDRDYPNRNYPNRDYPNRDYPDRDYPNRDYSNKDYPNRDHSNRAYPDRDYSDSMYTVYDKGRPVIPQPTESSAPAGTELPSLAQLEAELDRENYKRSYNSTLRNTLAILLVTAAVVIILAFMVFPIFRIYGKSMSPTLNEGEIVVAMKASSFSTGEVVVLSYNNKLLVKRVIAGPGQWVNIDVNGTVYVDSRPLDEPYLQAKAYGDCNLTFPYQVPDGKYFVMGDNRATSLDSRNSSVGCFSDEQITGKVLLRIWPLNAFGTVKSY